LRDLRIAVTGALPVFVGSLLLAAVECKPAFYEITWMTPRKFRSMVNLSRDADLPKAGLKGFTSFNERALQARASQPTPESSAKRREVGGATGDRETGNLQQSLIGTITV